MYKTIKDINPYHIATLKLLCQRLDGKIDDSAFICKLTKLNEEINKKKEIIKQNNQKLTEVKKEVVSVSRNILNFFDDTCFSF